MPTPIIVGKKVEEIELLDLFPSGEGKIAQYYGRIGNGKTYAATCDILDLLRRGKVVYVNYDIKYEGYDERASRIRLLITIFLPFIHRFYYFPKENLKYFEFSDSWAQKQGYKNFNDWLATRTDCEIFGDEGHVMFDSYVSTRMPIEQRAAVLHTRHFNRSINIISQRPTAIHVAMRANVNVFYKCEKRWQWGNLIRFRRVEYQDVTNDTVDEDEEKIISIKRYWGKKEIFNAYDTHYMRKGMKMSQRVLFEAYDLTWWDKIKLLFNFGTKDGSKNGSVKPQKPSLKDAIPLPPPSRAIVIHSGAGQTYRHLPVVNL